MLYVKEAAGSVDDVVRRLHEAAAAEQFGVLGEHDLKSRMAEKGVAFGPHCRIVEVCNPHQAREVLEGDMRISTALPCRISVYEQGGAVMAATLRPTALLDLFAAADLMAVAEDVEARIIRMIDAACA